MSDLQVSERDPGIKDIRAINHRRVAVTVVGSSGLKWVVEVSRLPQGVGTSPPASAEHLEPED